MRAAALFLAFALGGPGAPVMSGAAAAPVETEVTIGETPQILAGTLMRPQPPTDRAPVLILPGSGPTDRNGNSPAGISAQPYRLLAEGLAEQGLTTLRIDKRGIGASASAATSEQALRIETFAADAQLWADRLRSITGARCLWILGHSEGSLHALLAARGRSDVCGLILVSPIGRKAGDIIREQLRSNPANAPILDEALSILDRLEKGETVPDDGLHPALRPLFRSSVQPFLISMLRLDPASLLKDFEGPVLVLQGTTDLQTGPADAQRLGQARSAVEVRLVDGMNHVLKDAPLDPAGNIATYGRSNLPLHPEVVPTIADFVGR